MKPKIILSLAGLIVFAGVFGGGIYASDHIKLPVTVVKSAQTKPGYYLVSSVTDGDTFSVNMDGRIERVRLIGVDTPETVKPNSPQECYGKMASDFAKHTLKDQTVRLEADPINQNRDRYDRLLRYAYLSDGSLFNATLISQGYGFAYLSFPFSKSEEFRLLQVEARKNKVGVWQGDCIVQDQNGRLKSNTL